MKLLKVLDRTNTLEKNSFYKILDQLVEENTNVEVEEILSVNNRELKNIDNENITRVFELVRVNYKGVVEAMLESSLNQLDILIDILIKDGNCIISREWFSHLYNKSLEDLRTNVAEFKYKIDSGDKLIETGRLRDYRIYQRCTDVAYKNDGLINQDFKITHDEYSILRELAKSFGLSNEEVRLINFSILPIDKKEIDLVIKELKELGILFYSKKNHTLFVPDEIVRMLREIRGKMIADKYFRRILLGQKDSVINLVARRHNIDRKLERKEKIKKILNEGITLYDCLSNDFFKEDVSLSDRKKEINHIMELHNIPTKGSIVEEKISFIIEHFKTIEKDERVGISNDGYQRLILDLKNSQSEVNQILKDEFELQQEDVMDSDLLLDYNIKPIDILELIDESNLKTFAEEHEIKTRGGIIDQILANYTDSDNLLLENFIHIGNRDLQELKNNNIDIPTSEFGIKYEQLSKVMFADLGFNVDDDLKSEINTSKDKIDILINLGNDEVIIVECKTSKSSTYNKFSSVSRQIKSYHGSATKQGYRVLKTLLVAPDFSEDFVYECEMELELNLSLVKSEVLFNIWDGFKEAKHKVFPVNLLMRDVLIDDEKILRALKVKR
ncbi:MAG: hypothetical protein ACI8ZM_000597 [Crocinitomix sp.]|jgi:hypothetical protein